MNPYHVTIVISWTCWWFQSIWKLFSKVQRWTISLIPYLCVFIHLHRILKNNSWTNCILGDLRCQNSLENGNQGEIWEIVFKFVVINHTSWVTAINPTDRPKSVRNSCVIKVFGGVFMLSRCFLDCSVDVGFFVTGLSQISSFVSYLHQKGHKLCKFHQNRRYSMSGLFGALGLILLFLK